MKRKAMVIIVRSNTGKTRAVFDKCTSIKDMNKLFYGGRALFSVPCGDIDETQPATIRCLLGRISKRAAEYKIPLSKISGLKSFKYLASRNGMKFS